MAKQEDIVFGPFRLDRQGRTLSRNGVPMQLHGRALDVLVVLAGAAGGLVSKNELLDRVWSTVTVAENNLQKQISTLRKALGDDVIITAPGRGYRLAVPLPGADTASVADGPAGKASIAVLPFVNMSGDPEQEYFADGIVDDITTALSRTGWLLIIARASAFTYKGRSVDVRQVGHELGARYILQGSIRKSASRVRITGQLIDAASGLHVWADRFDADMVDIFDLQDRITESIVGAIEPNLQRAEIARVMAKPTESQDAYDFYLRALPHYRAHSRQGLDTAIALLSRALEVDPSYARAKAQLAAAYLMRIEQGWGVPADQDVALALARDALAAGSDDPQVLATAGVAFAQVGDHASSLTPLNRAISLHPYDTTGLHYLGLAYLQAGDGVTAIGHFERAIRLSPLDPEIGRRLGCLGIAYLMVGRYDDAATVLHRATKEHPTVKWIHRHLIHALVRVGRLDDARSAAASLLRYDPGHRIGPLPTTNYTKALNEDRHRALRAAGIPE